MFIALIHAATTAFGGFCSTLALVACVSTTLETPPDHPAHVDQRALSATSATHADAHDHAEHHELGAKTREGSALSSNDAVAADAASAAHWSCPMHPEVVRDEPGKCPICGMKLVEQKDSPPSGGDQ